MKKKTIHAVVKYFYPVAAGIETNMLETYSVLVKSGWRVIVHTSKNTLTEENVLKETEFIRGIKIKRYPYKWYGFLPKIGWKRVNIVTLHNFNIVPHSYILIYTIFLKILNKKRFRLILTPHGGFTPDWSIFSPITAQIKKIYHYTIGTLLINLAVDGVRAVSDWERGEIIKKGVKEDFVKTISNGLEDEAYLNVDAKASLEIKNKVKGYGKYIIQIGRIYSIKNYETTIKALSKVSKDLNFVIVGPVGNEEYLKQLNKFIKNLGVQKRVYFAGVVRGIDKYYMIKHAQMMVHMAFWESFCNAVHEGMSQGLVCIVANNSALPLLIKDSHNGFLVETKDYKGLAEKINYVYKYKNSKELVKIKQNNRIFGLKNSWRKTAGKLDYWFRARKELGTI